MHLKQKVSQFLKSNKLINNLVVKLFIIKNIKMSFFDVAEFFTFQAFKFVCNKKH